MKHQLRSAATTEGRRMAGARALWVANGMKKEQTKLSTKEFLTLYTGVLFELEDIENAIAQAENILD